MSREDMFVRWERTITRPATQEDVDQDIQWHKDHPCISAEPMKLGDEIEVEETVKLPGKYEVCDRCEGKGTHTNPSIDGNGITSSEWAEWDEEEQECYLSGGYDVTCHECDGKRVVLVVDESQCDKKLYKEYTDYMDQKAKDDYADARMRFWESGGYDY